MKRQGWGVGWEGARLLRRNFRPASPISELESWFERRKRKYEDGEGGITDEERSSEAITELEIIDRRCRRTDECKARGSGKLPPEARHSNNVLIGPLKMLPLTHVMSWARSSNRPRVWLLLIENTYLHFIF